MHTATKNVAIKTTAVIASRSTSGSALNIRCEVYQKAVRLPRRSLAKGARLRREIHKATDTPKGFASGRLPLWFHFVGVMISHAQPARKQRPPSGVMAPSQRRFESAMR